MEAAVRTERSVSAHLLTNVSWASIVAGAIVAAVLSLALLALGAGLGLAAVSPWSGSGVSGSTFTNITGVYLLMVAIMSSAIGDIWRRGCAPNRLIFTRTKCTSATALTVL